MPVQLLGRLIVVGCNANSEAFFDPLNLFYDTVAPRLVLLVVLHVEPPMSLHDEGNDISIAPADHRV